MNIIRPNFEKRGGLVVVIVQDAKTMRILMQGSVNEEAFCQTLATGRATLWSTSRNELWVKGATSGNYFKLTQPPLIDCDGDSLIYLVEGMGPACHTGQDSCFYRSVAQVDKVAFPSQDAALSTMECEVNL